MGKVEGKDGFRVTKKTKVCHAHFNNEDVSLESPRGIPLEVNGGCKANKRQLFDTSNEAKTTAV